MTSKIWRITLDTNPEDCNLKCTMCEEHSPFSTYIKEKLGGKHRRMPMEWLEDIFRQAKAMGVREIIPSTMGEPLIYKHFAYMVQLCYNYDMRMNLTTNSTFPRTTEKTATEWAKLLVPICSDIKISWNGATAETSKKVMLGLDFEQATKNVKDLIAVRNRHYELTGYYCRLTFQLTFLQNNMHELADIVRLAAEWGIDRVKGHQLWSHFQEIEHLSFRQNEASITQWNEYVKEAQEAAKGTKVLLENIIPLQATETKEVPFEYDCPFLNRELWVSATGKISPCCAPDELRNSLGDFGNIQTETLEKVLASEKYQYLAKNYKNIPLCQTCTMRRL